MISSKSRTQVDQLQRQLGLRFFSMRYYTLQEIGILARKKRLVVKGWYSFLGHEYIFFNVIVSHLITLMTLKSQKYLSLFPVKAHQIFAPDPKLQKQSLCNLFFLIKLNHLLKNGHWSKCSDKSQNINCASSFLKHDWMRGAPKYLLVFTKRLYNS